MLKRHIDTHAGEIGEIAHELEALTPKQRARARRRMERLERRRQAELALVRKQRRWERGRGRG